MLLADQRSDQACFLLTFLPRLVQREERGWWKGRAKRIARDLGRNSVVRQKWHVAFAEETVRGLAKGKADAEVLSARSSFSFSREDVGLDSAWDVMKGL